MNDIDQRLLQQHIEQVKKLKQLTSDAESRLFKADGSFDYAMFDCYIAYQSRVMDMYNKDITQLGSNDDGEKATMKEKPL